MFKLLYSLSLESWDSVVEMNVLSALRYNYYIMMSSTTKYCKIKTTVNTMYLLGVMISKY
jgi:hypothetical protein